MFSLIKLHIFGVLRRHSGCSFPMRESGFELPVATDLELKQVATVLSQTLRIRYECHEALGDDLKNGCPCTSQRRGVGRL